MKALETGFVFYNCGKVSGASQIHKHMQCFPEANFPTQARLPLSLAVEKYVLEV